MPASTVTVMSSGRYSTTRRKAERSTDSTREESRIKSERAVIVETGTTSIRGGQIHVPRVVENAAAIRARNQFLIALHAENDRGRQFHMAAAAKAVFDPDDSGAAVGAPKAIVFCARPFFDSFDEFCVVGAKFIQFALKRNFAIIERFDIVFDLF